MKNKMTMINRFIKSKLGIIMLLAVLFYCVPYILISSATPVQISNQVVKLNDGYGYEILLEDKVIIHQEYIPGIKGMKKFQSGENAQKVADLVVEKMERKESPALNRSDLESVGLVLD